MNRKHGYQMSDSLIIMILLNLSGGTQDACSYFLRDHVFANAQTGNIVLMGCYLISEDLRDSIRYFLPVFCFALGVLTACFIRSKCRHTGKIHWRHLVLVMEILLLFVVGFLPPQVNWLANALTSCHAGAVLPHGQRQRLCQHHVYRQSAKWYGSSLPVYNREKERRRKNRSHLSDCYHLLCHWRSLRRSPDHVFFLPHHMDFLRNSDSLLPSDAN